MYQVTGFRHLESSHCPPACQMKVACHRKPPIVGERRRFSGMWGCIHHEPVMLMFVSAHVCRALQAMQDRATIHRDFASLMGPKLVAGGAAVRRSSDFQLSLENLPTLKAFGSSLSPGKAAAVQGTGSSTAASGNQHNQPSGGTRRAHGRAEFDGDGKGIGISSSSGKGNSTPRYSAAETPKRLRIREVAQSPISPMSAWSPH